MLTKLQRLPWQFRWAIKWAVLVVTVFAVSFPNPVVFARHFRHARNPNAMIDPTLPALQPWVEQVRQRLDPEMPPPKALRVVQHFVYEKVPYKYDWETWGCADYLPTLSEVLETGSEDCDGQAVVAASLLRNLGYRAVLVSDFAHMWVKTDKGETMSPGKRTGAVATDKGFRIDWAAVLDTVPSATGLGIALFPVGREIIVLAVVWLVLLTPQVRWGVRLLCLLIMVDGLLILRAGGASWRDPSVWLQWTGLVQIIGTGAVLAVIGRRAARLSSGGAAAPDDAVAT